MALRLTHAITPEQMAKLKEDFHAADQDNSKSLNRDEMMKLELGLSPQELDAAIKMHDTNGDGDINFKEFVSLMDANTGVQEGDDEVKEMFNLIDKNGDGTITIKEVEKLIKKVGMKGDIRKCDLRKLIEKADQEGDGELTFEEFKKYLDSF